MVFCVGLLSVPTMGALASVLLNQLLFDRSRAIWLEKDRLYYLNSFYWRIDTNLIEDVFVGPYGNMSYTYIIFKKRDGRMKVIPTPLLLEPPTEIVAKIKSEIR
jgi:hypothetical protein